ncbi:hypothetical protein MMC34_008530 [Xylographa carneopallida]|nr:hypothetical protein [Xylographa carneopallida]
MSAINPSSLTLSCEAANAGSSALAGDCIYAYFAYSPSKAADLFFLLFFATLTLLVACQAQRAKQYWLHSLSLFGALECAGYLARALLLYDTNSSAFTAQLVLLILAPTCLALCCYLVLGKSITYVFSTYSDGQTSNWLTRHPGWLPGFFLCSDMSYLFVQALGAAILAHAETAAQSAAGRAVEVVGLSLQLVNFGTFLLVTAYVWRTMRSRANGAGALTASLGPACAALAAIMSMLLLRNLYRVAEFCSGGFTSGYLQQSEAWYLVFDASLMALALAVAVLFDFSKRLPAECLHGTALCGVVTCITKYQAGVERAQSMTTVKVTLSAESNTVDESAQRSESPETSETGAERYGF